MTRREGGGREGMKISHVGTYVLMLWEEVGEEEVVVWNVPPYGTVEHLVLQWHIVLVR